MLDQVTKMRYPVHEDENYVMLYMWLYHPSPNLCWLLSHGVTCLRLQRLLLRVIVLRRWKAGQRLLFVLGFMTHFRWHLLNSTWSCSACCLLRRSPKGFMGRGPLHPLTPLRTFSNGEEIFGFDILSKIDHWDWNLLSMWSLPNFLCVLIDIVSNIGKDISCLNTTHVPRTRLIVDMYIGRLMTVVFLTFLNSFVDDGYMMTLTQNYVNL